MRIMQAYPEVQYGDAISSIMLRLHEINIEQGWEDTMLAYTSQLPEVQHFGIAQSYTKAQLLKKFMQMPDKKKNIKAYLAQRQASPINLGSIIQDADIRIWHLGITYKLMEQNIQPNDFVFFYGLNYPYLSASPEAIIESYKALTWLKALKPRMVAESQWTASQLISLGYQKESITILPLFHAYSEPYRKHDASKPKLLAYGRYAKNKRIPEIARMCYENDISLIAFGDNSKYAEFRQQHAQASQYATKSIRLLGKQASRDRFYDEANIYICNSENEGFNMGIVESYANSLPVLARRGTAMDELVKDGYNGFLFSDISEVPGLIAKIMKNYKQMSYNAWQHSQNFTYEKFKERYLRISNEYKKV